MQEWIELYEQGKSPYEIAEECGTYANKVRRFLKKHIPIRSKGDAQAAALKSGRKRHPTKGLKRSEEEKIKISDGINNFWENIEDDQYQEIVETARENWNSRSKAEKARIQSAAHEGMRRASKEGSKAELYVVDIIEDAGWKALRHRTDIVKNHDLEVDIYIPSISVIIEVDGISHYEPIWGDKVLEKTVKADNEKSGLLLDRGFVLIRIKYMVKNLTEKAKRKIKSELLPILKSVENKFPSKDKRYIEIEIS